MLFLKVWGLLEGFMEPLASYGGKKRSHQEKKSSRVRVQQQECGLCWEKVDTGTKTCLREKEIRK